MIERYRVNLGANAHARVERSARSRARGTGLSTFTAAGGIPYSTAATTLAVLAIGTGLQVMRTNAGPTAPEWHTLTAGDTTSPGSRKPTIRM